MNQAHRVKYCMLRNLISFSDGASGFCRVRDDALLPADALLTRQQTKNL